MAQQKTRKKKNLFNLINFENIKNPDNFLNKCWKNGLFYNKYKIMVIILVLILIRLNQQYILIHNLKWVTEWCL